MFCEVVQQILIRWFRTYYQGIIQRKSVPGSWMLPCLVIFFRNFILIWKCQKWSWNRGTLVSATAIYQTQCPFTVLSAFFLFFQMLPYDLDYSLTILQKLYFYYLSPFCEWFMLLYNNISNYLCHFKAMILG